MKGFTVGMHVKTSDGYEGVITAVKENGFLVKLSIGGTYLYPGVELKEINA